MAHRPMQHAAAPSTLRGVWDGWCVLPLIAGLVFVAAAVDAARRETPTIDEFAHVPAGLLHWRTGQFELYRNNPPLGKMWVALPLALQASVEAPTFQGSSVGWAPWFYGTQFERAAGDRYLGLMTLARLMTVPLVLATAALVFVWCRQLYGTFAAALASSLFLLSPTLLAHGHLATVDVASAATIFAAVFALRWCAAAPRWQRDVLAGGTLGLALAIKFSALFLVPLAPLMFIAAAWHNLGPRRVPALAKHLAVCTLSAWLVLNASMAFSGTFDSIASLQPRSKSLQNAVSRLPGRLPLFLPRVYVEGLDALKEDIEIGGYAGYLHGEWSLDGWASYYFIAYALKESEPVVILTALSLVAFPLVVRDWRQMMLVAAPPAVLLLIAAFLNTLCLGIRYILPAFPFLFVMQGACFAWAERWLAARHAPSKTKPAEHRWDRRWLLAAPLVGYAVVLTALVHPGYLSYFNRFVGGPAHGSDWLIDSNLDWGQDLYRLPGLEAQFGVDRWKLLYFGHVDPRRYEVLYDVVGPRPEPGVYAVSVNYWKGISYPLLSGQNHAEYVQNRIAWIKRLIPTDIVASLAIFDLRSPNPGQPIRAEDEYNQGFLQFVRGEPQAAAVALENVVKRKPTLFEAHLELGNVYDALDQSAKACESFRRAIALRGDRHEAFNNLAWQLASSPEPALANPAEAVRLAERACRLTRRENLVYLDTLAVAYAAAGHQADAIAVCQEGLQKSLAANNRPQIAAFRDRLQSLSPQTAPSPTSSTR